MLLYAVVCSAMLKLFPRSSPCYVARNGKNICKQKAVVAGSFQLTAILKELGYSVIVLPEVRKYLWCLSWDSRMQPTCLVRDNRESAIEILRSWLVILLDVKFRIVVHIVGKGHW